jgi:type I restriction enzyme, S subunit
MRSDGHQASGWPTASLGELVRIRHGFAFKGEYFHDEGPGDILVTPGNFAIGGGFTWHKTKYYTGPVDDRFVLRPGAVMITMTDLSKGADTLGSPAIVPPPPDGARLLHNQRLGLVEITAPDRLDPRFLYWALRTETYRRQVVASATGTTVKHTSPARIGEALVPLPPLSDQRAIAAILGSLDDKVESNHRLGRLFEETAATIFRARFVDFVGVEEFDESAVGRIPRGWRVAPAGNVLKVVGGGTPSTKEGRFWNGQHCWATPKDLAGIRSPIVLDTDRHLTDEGVNRISSKSLPLRTVLLSSRAPVGYTAISFVPIAVNQGFIAIPPSDGIPSEFVLFWLREHMAEIKAHAGGTTFAEISKRQFRSLPMLLPSRETLRGFEGVARPMFDLIAGAEVEARTLAQLRDALLPKLISGQIRVPDTADPAEVIEPALA